MSPIFILLAVLTVGGSLAAVTLRNPVHCALSLVVVFVGLAGFYLGMGAQFLGLAQVLVYVGAVAILLVFVMLMTRGEGEGETAGSGGGWTGWLVSGLVAMVLVAAVLAAGRLPQRETVAESAGVRELGETLMTDYVLPLQGVGVLLTAALIGAGVLALPERRPRPPGANPR